MGHAMTHRIATYSVRNDGGAWLSPNFRAKEFACRDGSDKILVDLRLVHILQQIRDYFGRPVAINSAYRTVSYNAKVGGAKASQHCLGTAADITVGGVSPSSVAAYAETLLVDTGGIGRYANFTHIDVREKKVRWEG